MEWLFALIGFFAGFFLRHIQTVVLSSPKLKFKLEMLMWRFKFFFRHKIGKRQ